MTFKENCKKIEPPCLAAWRPVGLAYISQPPVGHSARQDNRALKRLRSGSVMQTNMFVCATPTIALVPKATNRERVELEVPIEVRDLAMVAHAQEEGFVAIVLAR